MSRPDMQLGGGATQSVESTYYPQPGETDFIGPMLPVDSYAGADEFSMRLKAVKDGNLTLGEALGSDYRSRSPRDANGKVVVNRFGSPESGSRSSLADVRGYGQTYPALQSQINELDSLVGSGFMSREDADQALLNSARATSTLKSDYEVPLKTTASMSAWDGVVRESPLARMDREARAPGANRIENQIGPVIQPFVLSAIPGGQYVLAMQGAHQLGTGYAQVQGGETALGTLNMLAGGMQIFGSGAVVMSQQSSATSSLFGRTALADVWKMRDTTRGTAIESHLAATEYKDWFNVGQLNNGKFPLVDFQNGNTLVSLKSVNTKGSTWMTRMEDHIYDLGRNGATVDNRLATMVLDLRVQPGGLKAAQPLINYGRQNGVTVVVREFK